jgi:hypothetical protein
MARALPTSLKTGSLVSRDHFFEQFLEAGAGHRHMLREVLRRGLLASFSVLEHGGLPLSREDLSHLIPSKEA